MVPFIIYWGVILACIAWLALSIYFSIFYLVRKENGNLWAFAFFNVLAAIVLAITLVVYRTWGWGITQYSSLIDHYLLSLANRKCSLFQYFFLKSFAI